MKVCEQENINNSKIKKIPLRRCVACHQMIDKRELVRVVKMADNNYVVDITGKMDGRGAYVCKNIECLEKSKKVKGFERSFKSGAPKNIYEKLEELKNELFVREEIK